MTGLGRRRYIWFVIPLLLVITSTSASAQSGSLSSTTTSTLKPEQMKALPEFQSAVASDPQFARYVQIADQCMDRLLAGNATINPLQCQTSLQQGADMWCGFANFDQLKCDYSSQVALAFKNFNNDMEQLLGPGGGGNVPSANELLDSLMNDLPSSSGR